MYVKWDVLSYVKVLVQVFPFFVVSVRVRSVSNIF